MEYDRQRRVLPILIELHSTGAECIRVGMEAVAFAGRDVLLRMVAPCQSEQQRRDDNRFHGSFPFDHPRQFVTVYTESRGLLLLPVSFLL